MRVLRVGLCALLVFAVLAHGAVEIWSEGILEIVAGLLLLFWAVLASLQRDIEIRWNLLNWPILGFVAIGLLQLLLRITAYPFLTRTELLRVASCWIVFFLATQAFRTRTDLRKLAWFLVIFCFAVSLFAIVQYFTATNQIYWFRPVVGDIRPFGPFVNRNHFAGFVELTLPTALGLLMLGGSRRDQAPLTIVMTLVPIGAVVLSTSRAGIIGVALEIVSVMLLSRLGLRRWGWSRLAALAFVAIGAVALIAWLGAETAVARFLPGGAAGVSVARRVSMVRGAMGVFLAHPIAGSGLGTIVDTYPLYETMYDGKLVDHVHDDYAEALAETGLLGGVCGLAFLLLLFRQAQRNLSAEQGSFSRALHVGAVAALVGLLWHSFVDFNLHILSNAFLVLVQASIAISPPLASESSRRVGRQSTQGFVQWSLK
jgi:O-antigen ligase